MDVYKCQQCGRIWDGQGIEIPKTFKGLDTIHFTVYEVPRCNSCQLVARVRAGDVEVEG